MKRNIFISFSHVDRELMEAVRVHLEPFGDLHPWSDQEIGAGESWEQEIRGAMSRADAAVLLVSPDFLASHYISEVEVPYLMEAANAGKLVFAPLFVRHANPEQRIYKQILKPNSSELGARITDFQGFNQPNQPLASLSVAERDRLLAESARELEERLKNKPAVRRGKSGQPQRALTVELKLKGGHLDRTYSRPGQDTLLQNSTSVDFDRLQSLPEKERGERLFEVLFGGSLEWSRILPPAFGREGTPSVFFNVRVRIHTPHAELLDLPWPSCCWKGHCLADQGWTFELVSHPGRPPARQLEAPCSVLMLGSEVDGQEALEVEAHALAFQSLLNRAWDNPVSLDLRREQTYDGALKALDARPGLLYVYAHARDVGGHLEILLQDASGKPCPLRFEEFAERFASRSPSVVVLHTVGPCPPALALPGAAAVLHLRRAAPSQEGRQQALFFWDDVLAGGKNPANAFHELGSRVRTRGLIWTDYDPFETRHSDRTPKVDRPRSRLDRRKQRDAVTGLVRDLVRSHQRRLTCAVAYGSKGNLVGHFAQQVLDTLKDSPELARVQRIDLSFPSEALNGRKPRVEDFDLHFRERFHIQFEQPLADALRKARRRGGIAPLVYFLNWGYYGEEKDVGGPALTSWLTFCAEHLVSAVEGTDRILSYVALGLEGCRHKGFLGFLDTQSRRPGLDQNRFHLEPLQPLDIITPQDLHLFLADDDNTSCDPTYRGEMAERICQFTGGDFEATVELLENAERGNQWPELHRTLPKAEPPKPVEDF